MIAVPGETPSFPPMIVHTGAPAQVAVEAAMTAKFSQVPRSIDAGELLGELLGEVLVLGDVLGPALTVGMVLGDASAAAVACQKQRKEHCQWC